MTNVKLKKLTYKNFLSRGDEEMVLQLDTGKTTFLTGNNGCGKSVNVSALLFALFGDVERKITKSKIVNNINKKDCLVTLTFDINKDVYKVIRGIKKDVFEIYKNNKMIDKPSNLRDYQKILEEIITVDMDTFCKLVVMSKTNYTPFLAMNTPQRRTFIEELLETHILTLMNQEVKEKTREIKTDLALIEKDVTNSTSLLSNDTIRLDNLKETIASKEQSIKSKIENLKNKERERLYEEKQQKIDEINQKIVFEEENNSDLQDINIQIKEAEQSLSELEKAILDMNYHSVYMEEAELLVVQSQKELENLQKQLKDSKYKLDNLEREGKQAKNEFEKAKNNPNCPTCGKSLDNHKLTVKELSSNLKLMRDIYANAFNKYEEIEEDFNNANKLYEEETKNLEKIKKLKNDYEEKLLEKTNIVKKISHLKSMQDVSESSQVKFLKSKLREVEEYDIEAYILEEVKEMEAQFSLLDYEGLKDLELSVKKHKDKCDYYKKRKQEIDKDKLYNDTMSSFLKDDGIKAVVVKKYIPFLNQRINYYLDKLGLFLYFEMDEGFNEVLKFNYRSEYSYFNLSEGERQRVDLAIMFAFRDVAKMKNSSMFNVFIMDDATGALDSEGVSSILDLIQEKEEGVTTIMVSHDQDSYMEVFEDVYVFTKEKGFSITEKL